MCPERQKTLSLQHLIHLLMNRLLQPWLISSVITAAVLILCLMPTSVPVSAPTGTDKVVHAVMFMALAWLYTVDLGGGLNRIRTRSVKRPGILTAQAGWVMVSLLGCLTEVLQDRMALGRSGDTADAVADIIGAAVGAALAWWVLRRHTSRQS